MRAVERSKSAEPAVARTVFVLAVRVDLVDPHLVHCRFDTISAPNLGSKSSHSKRNGKLTEDEEDDVVSEARQPVQKRHLDDEREKVVWGQGGTRRSARL